MKDRFSKEEIGMKVTYSYSSTHELTNTIYGLVIDFFPVLLFIGFYFEITFLSLREEINVLIFILILLYSFFHFYKIFIDSNRIVLRKYEIPILGLKEKVKFTFLADIHYGPEYYGAKDAKVRKIVDTVNSLNNDLVIIAGDFVCDKLDPGIALRLSEIKTENKYATLGNHDSLYLKDDLGKMPEQFLRMMKKSNLKFLNNTGFEYKEIYVGGITDLYSRDFNIDKAFQNAEKNIRILISHNPDIVDFVEENDNISLILSGHTHGGQIYLPVIGPVLPIPCKNKWIVKGLYTLKNKTKLFVTEGLGFSKTRMKIGIVNEVCEITLLPLA